MFQPAGACSGGTVRAPYESGGSICIAPTACTVPLGAACMLASDGTECWPVLEQINYHTRWGRARPNTLGLVSYWDGPQELYQMDAYGRVYQAGAPPVRPFGTWTWKGSSRGREVCPPARPTPCPSPSPSPTPSPQPTPGPSPTPTPTPNPSPTPASCPVMVCIHAQVHLAAGPGGLLPGPTACQGCRVVIDSTPLFEVCLARGRCNAEHDTYCHGRLCEDARGYAWRQTGGPNTLWRIQEPGPDRGYQIVVDTPVSGIYRFEVCAANPIDTEGFPVQVGQECNPISFEVP